MKFQLVVTIFFFALSALCKDTSLEDFKGKVLSYRGGSTLLFLDMNTGQQDEILDSNILFLDDYSVEREVKNPNPNLIYFRKTTLNNSSVYSLPRKILENELANGHFGNWEKNKYLDARENQIKNSIKRFYGKNIVTQGSDLTLKNNGEDISISSKTKLFIAPPELVKKSGDYDPTQVYFKVLNSNKIKDGEFYSLSLFDFEALTAKEQFSKWFKDKYEENGRISKVLIKTQQFPIAISSDSNYVPMEENKYYTMEKDAPSVLIQTRLHGKKSYLRKGDKFYIVDESSGPNEDIYIIKDGDSARYKVVNDILLYNIFIQGKVKAGDPVDFNKDVHLSATPKKTSDTKETSTDKEDAYRSAPSVSGVSGTVTRTLEQIGQFTEPAKPDICKHCQEDYNKLFEECNSENNYAQSALEKLLNEAEVNEIQDEKYCILASLKKPSSFPMARCNGNKRVGWKHQACISKEYVSFVYKELKDISSCFNNLEIKEMIPLINNESQFNYNAYNRNKSRTLNATGLLQMTQDVVDSQVYIRRYFNEHSDLFNDSKYCSTAFHDLKTHPLSKERNVCIRTEIPNGFRKNLLLTIAQYSKFKNEAELKLQAIESTYPYKTIFDPDTRVRLKTELARLMHNRGDSKITTLMEMFFYDLIHGRKFLDSPKKSGTRDVVIDTQELDQLDSSGKRIYDPKNNFKSVIKDVPVIRKHPHGNPNIHPLWGRNSFKMPINHIEFKTFFSSYVFYESKRTKIGNRKPSKNNTQLVENVYKSNRDRYLEPYSKDHDLEGGTFLHKVTCHERMLDLGARALSKKPNLSCGEPSPTSEEIEDLRLNVGWSSNICGISGNETVTYEQRVCSTRNPATANNLTSQAKANLKNNDDYLYNCQMHTLRGMAARPLLEFYSKNPGNYR